MGVDSNVGVDTSSASTGDNQRSVPQTAMDLVHYFRQHAAEARAIGQTDFAAHLEQRARILEEGTLQNFLSYEREVEASRLREWEGERRHYRDWQLENQRQVIGLGQHALRGLALINAGAVVALLAFLGNVWTKGVIIEPFLAAMWAFALGVGLAALASALSYLTQLLYGAESEKISRCAKGLHVTTVVVSLAALGVFCMGSYRTLEAFRDQEIRPAASAVADATASDRELERRNYPPPKRPPSEPPKPTAPVAPNSPAKSPEK